MNVGIYVFDDAEVLDFSGPFEVFATASRLAGDSQTFSASLISESGAAVRARGGMQVVPHYSLSDHGPIDLLIIAGGVHPGEMEKPGVMAWIERQSRSVAVTATVCTGIFLLAQARPDLACRVTTHWEDLPELRARFPQLEVVEGVRWVDAGTVVSSAGISAGIDMSLHLVSRLHSAELAQATARQMDFHWTQNP